MPLKRESFLVPHCPVCDKRIDLQHSGDSSFQVWSKKAEVVEAVQDTDGDTFEEKLANSCSDRECENKFRHRACLKRPCGYCKGKKAP
jgi:hypothetical protein